MGRVLRILAPGGYGKSTQAARWIECEPRAVGWVDLERVDNDPYVLGAALARALPPGDLSDTASWMTPQDIGGFMHAVVPEFGARVRACPTPFSLVLDDVHHVDAEPSLALVDALAENLPPRSTLVLSGRAHHGEGSIGRLRLHPGVIDITVDDLALDVTETYEMLVAMGLQPGPGDISALGDRFEGWAAGLRLAGLSLRARGDASWPLSELSGDASYVVDYLRAEWTGQLHEDDLRFLREVACLERCTGEMCDAVLGTTGSAALLRRIHRDEMLLLPLDQRDQWFKMHPLLVHWLSADLKDVDPGRWQQIHRSAARWWSGRGDIDLALDHAMLSGDLTASEALVGAHGGSYLTRGMSTTVRRWLSAFPLEHVRESAALCGVGAVDALHLGDGERALQWFGQLARIARLDLLDELSADEPVLWACTLRATLEGAPSRDLIPFAEHACTHMRGGPWHGLAHFALGGLQFLGGDNRASATFAAGAREAVFASSPILVANCTAGGAILAELRGERDRAAAATRRAEGLLVEANGQHVPTTALVSAMRSLIEARDGRRDTAAEAVELTRRKLLGFGTIAPWFNVMARLPLVRTSLLLHDRTTSRALLREIDHHLRTEPDDNGVSEHLATLRASVEAAVQVSPDRSVSLTVAEMRVLQCLPTNLSLSEIAKRLYLSRNTVKSHVAAIYRKLGSTSRGHAVELARQSGLLDEPAT